MVPSGTVLWENLAPHVAEELGAPENSESGCRRQLMIRPPLWQLFLSEPGEDNLFSKQRDLVVC